MSEKGGGKTGRQRQMDRERERREEGRREKGGGKGGRERQLER